MHHRLLPTAGHRPSDYEGPILTYTADLIPFTGLHIPEAAVPALYHFDGSNRQALSTRGMGLYPVGLQVTFRAASRLRPFAGGHTGLFYFSKPVPDARGRQLNFAAGIGGGAKVSLGPRTILTVGYRYHHLSNGFRGSINPGLDANVLYLGVGIAL